VRVTQFPNPAEVYVHGLRSLYEHAVGRPVLARLRALYAADRERERARAREVNTLMQPLRRRIIDSAGARAAPFVAPSRARARASRPPLAFTDPSHVDHPVPLSRNTDFSPLPSRPRPFLTGRPSDVIAHAPGRHHAPSPTTNRRVLVVVVVGRTRVLPVQLSPLETTYRSERWGSRQQ